MPDRGLSALPEPVVGDLFFDIEGARHYSEDGKEFRLQYLFGVIDTGDADASGAPRYTQIWAFDRRDEKRAFEDGSRMDTLWYLFIRPACHSVSIRLVSITGP